MALYLVKLLVKQVEVADDLREVELVDALQVVVEYFVGAFDRFVESPITLDRSRQRWFVVFATFLQRLFLARRHISIWKLRVQSEFVHALVIWCDVAHAGVRTNLRASYPRLIFDNWWTFDVIAAAHQIGELHNKILRIVYEN